MLSYMIRRTLRDPTSGRSSSKVMRPSIALLSRTLSRRICRRRIFGTSTIFTICLRVNNSLSREVCGRGYVSHWKVSLVRFLIVVNFRNFVVFCDNLQKFGHCETHMDQKVALYCHKIRAGFRLSVKLPGTVLMLFLWRA